MNATSRERRAQLRHLTRELRAHNRARRLVATGAPQAARTHLLAAGLDTATAQRFAAAFSRNVLPTDRRVTRIKLAGRRTARVNVKLYSAATFAARLATYRPRDPHFAHLFAATATRVLEAA
jgi:hypothetical protein